MSAFWNLWIAGFVTANIVGIAWLLYATSRGRKGDQAAGPETTGHVWDGDLREYNNPLPRWWLWVFYGTIAFGIIYLCLFPGYGAFRGVLGWTSSGQWQAQKAEADVVVAREFAKFEGRSVAELSRDPDAIRIAKNLFAANCAACHGSDAHGAKGFPNLTNPNLSWGHSEDAIVATISGGRMGVMPAWKDAIGDAGVNEVANYVYALNGRTAPDPKAAAAGAERFASVCSACHGADGKGNALLGAPNLTDEVWIYGGSLATIKETVALGRQNRMPAWGEVLGEKKVKLLAAYIYSLSPAAAPLAQATDTAN